MAANKSRFMCGSPCSAVLIFNFGGCAVLYSKFTNCASYPNGWQDQASKVRIEPLLFPSSIVIVSEKLQTQFLHFRKFGSAMTVLPCSSAANGGVQCRAHKTRCAKWLLRMNGLAGADLPFTQRVHRSDVGCKAHQRRSRFRQAARRTDFIVRGRLHIVDIDRMHEQACDLNRWVLTIERPYQGCARWSTKHTAAWVSASRMAAASPLPSRPAELLSRPSIRAQPSGRQNPPSSKSYS
jgi:hypothetical protein